MNERKVIEIEVNATNPVEYLACLGIFEIASRFDETTLAHWKMDESKTIFVIESDKLDDKTLLEIIVPTLTDWKNWEVIENEKGKPISLKVNFSNAENIIKSVFFDWWYENIAENGDMENSSWKMYAAGQNPKQIVATKLIPKGEKEIKGKQITSINQIFRLTIKTQSKFGFDPRPCVNALDLGFVPNDLSAKDKGVPTYFGLEILSTIGAQLFFPTRTANNARETKSTRGWNKNKKDDFFIYCLWNKKIPVSLARVLASNCEVSFGKVPTHKSLKAKRGDYLGNMAFSTLTNLRGKNYE